MRFALEADKEQRHDVEQMERDSLCMVSKTGHGATDSSQLKALAGLSENPRLFPSTYAGLLTAACTSSSRGPNAFWPPCTSTHM